MLDFQTQLKSVGEYGMVEGVTHPIAFVTGLPRVKMGELVVFEDGHVGEVVALDPQGAKVLAYSKQPAILGARVVRSETFLTTPVGDDLLGKVIDPLGNLIYSHND
jgi:F-type H+-transporting ATPase subunit alpha